MWWSTGSRLTSWLLHKISLRLGVRLSLRWDYVQFPFLSFPSHPSVQVFLLLVSPSSPGLNRSVSLWSDPGPQVSFSPHYSITTQWLSRSSHLKQTAKQIHTRVQPSQGVSHLKRGQQVNQNTFLRDRISRGVRKWSVKFHASGGKQR